MASSNETVSVLRELIDTCRDGLEGYRTAAERVEDGELRSLFERYASKRAEFVGELEHEVLRLGENPTSMRTLGETVEHGWMSIREALTANDRESVVAECERGEDEALETYREALGAPLPAPIRSIVERQYQDVLRAHDRLRAIERGD
jgi:uncharacterized protein (TIGR02284 family)